MNNIINDLRERERGIIERILKSKLDELGISIDFSIESKRRFKAFCVEIKGNEESYYWNDGTIEGKRIVTFIKNEKRIDDCDIQDCKIVTTFDYY